MGLDRWKKARFPLRNLWIGVPTRLGIRKSGLTKLQHDVSMCKYDDVHMMWEMLKRKTNKASPNRPGRTKKRSFWNLFDWVRFAPCMCH